MTLSRSNSLFSRFQRDSELELFEFNSAAVTSIFCLFTFSNFFPSEPGDKFWKFRDFLPEMSLTDQILARARPFLEKFRKTLFYISSIPSSNHETTNKPRPPRSQTKNRKRTTQTAQFNQNPRTHSPAQTARPAHPQYQTSTKADAFQTFQTHHEVQFSKNELQ